MKIKKILGLILFAFIGVLALASCKKSNFEIEYEGKTYSGDLYYGNYLNDYLLVSETNMYQITFVMDNGKSRIWLRDRGYQKIDANTWEHPIDYTYYVLINNGQEIIAREGLMIYIKTDYIKELQEG